MAHCHARRRGTVLRVRTSTGLSRIIAGLFALVLLAGAGPTSPGRDITLETRTVRFDPQHPEAARFGALQWRGGIEVWSGDKAFGGFSGLAVSADGGSLVAVSDKGRWLTANLIYRNGRLAAVGQARMAPMIGADGRPLNGKDDSDAESVTADGGGALLVSFERNNRLLRYDFSGPAPSPPEKIELPPALDASPYNKSIEAIGRFAPVGRLGGILIVITERMLDQRGNIIGWLIGTGPARRFTLRRIGDFDVTDLAILPGGDVVTLERRFSLLNGPGMMMRRIARDTIRAGALLDGPVLLRAGASYSIDNMEGLSLHRSEDGELRLTLISDDNFNLLQRTLIMQFAISE